MHWRIYGEGLSAEFFGLIESLEEISRRWEGCRDHHPDQSQDLATKYSLMLKGLHSRCLIDETFGKDILGYSEFIPNTNRGGLLPPLSLPNCRLSSPSQSHLGDATQSPKNNSRMSRPSISHNISRGVRSPTTILNNSFHDNIASPMTTAASSVVANNYVSSGATTHPVTSSLRDNGPGPFSGLALNNSNWGPGRPGRIAAAEPIEDELSAMSDILLGQQFMEMDRVIPFDGTDFDYQETYSW